MIEGIFHRSTDIMFGDLDLIDEAFSGPITR